MIHFWQGFFTGMLFALLMLVMLVRNNLKPR